MAYTIRKWHPDNQILMGIPHLVNQCKHYARTHTHTHDANCIKKWLFIAVPIDGHRAILILCIVNFFLFFSSSLPHRPLSFLVSSLSILFFLYLSLLHVLSLSLLLCLSLFSLYLFLSPLFCNPSIASILPQVDLNAESIWPVFYFLHFPRMTHLTLSKIY